ncbi:iron ABC transporter permease [Frigidibacter albus]
MTPLPASRRVWRLGRWSVLWSGRGLAVAGVLALAGVLLALALLGTGTMKLGWPEILAGLTGRSDSVAVANVIWRIRLPRVLTAALVGAALGMGGAVFQSVSRNPLGSPDVIGFTTGAATGAIVQIVLVNSDPFRTALAAVLSGLATAALVLVLARRGGRAEGYRLVLVGIGVGSLLAGVNTVLLVMGDLDQAIAAQLWLAGSLNTRTWSHVGAVAAGVGLLAPVLLSHARRLSLLEMGDDTAAQLGVPVERTRFVLVLAAVGLTSVATAAAGPIAFVALAAPQLARRLTRSSGVPLVASALMGGVLLLGADLIGQRLSFSLTLPVGLMTGLLGGLYLLWLLSRRSG